MKRLSVAQEKALELVDQTPLNLRRMVSKQTVNALLRAEYITESFVRDRLEHTITQTGHAALWEQSDKQEMGRRHKEDAHA